MTFEKGVHYPKKTRGKYKKRTPTEKVNAAIKKVIAKEGKDPKGTSIALYNLFHGLYKQAIGGDVQAHREFMDRYAGKVTQKVEGDVTHYLVQIGGKELEVKDVVEGELIAPTDS